jgi:hypothetical protein
MFRWQPWSWRDALAIFCVVLLVLIFWRSFHLEGI